MRLHPPIYCHSRPSIISRNLRLSCPNEKHNLSIIAIRYLYLFLHAPYGPVELYLQQYSQNRKGRENAFRALTIVEIILSKTIVRDI